MFHFTIDDYLNQFIPRNRLDRLPRPIGRFLGAHSAKPVGDHIVWIDIIVSTFCAVLLLEAVFINRTVFSQHHGHTIFASYGATAILCFNASQAPLSQPRNVLMGHFLASVIGVSILKLFLLSASGRENYYVGGAISVAITSVLMSITNCVHPPAGASAILPLIDSEIAAMGWWFLPAQLVSLVLMIAVACVTNNIFRSYPVFWWTPANLTGSKQSSVESSASLTEKKPVTIRPVVGAKTIVILAEGVTIPTGFGLENVDNEWLESTMQNLKKLQKPQAV